MAFTYTFAFNSVPNAANPYGVPNLNFYNRDFTLSTSAGLKLDFSGVAVQNIEITYSKLAGYSPSGRPVLGDPQVFRIITNYLTSAAAGRQLLLWERLAHPTNLSLLVLKTLSLQLARGS